MNRLIFSTAFLLGAAAIAWMGSYFLGSDRLALAVTAVIGCVYTIGFIEMLQFRRATSTLESALSNPPAQGEGDSGALENWLARLDPSLHNAVRLRIEGERVGLPAPVLAPYLVGLLVMLGLLGTFVGMVDTLKGAVFALEGTTELQAIRAGLAAPINGLSLAFGTSVAGVAASAMLGLASTLSRRDRMLATRQLDSKISGVFREQSLSHQRREAYRAMQAQASALPEVADKLHALADKLEHMGENLGDRLIANQDQFHQSVQRAYTDLATSVDKSLASSMAQSGKLAGESIKPHVLEAMAGISAQTSTTQKQLTEASQAHFQAFSGELERTATALLASLGESASSWREQQQSDDQQRLADWNQALTETQEKNQSRLLQTVQTFTTELKDVSKAQQASFAGATSEFETLSSTLGSRLQEVAQTFSTELKDVSSAQQASLSSATQELEERYGALTEHWLELARTFSGELQDISSTQQASYSSTTKEFEALSASLGSQWVQAGQQLGDITTTLKTELSTLRDEEQTRGEAAVERLSQLEEAVAGHLGKLGKELEQPMSRLIESASETPRAAAEVIGQLRLEISNNIERDNSLLEERSRIMEELNTLSESLQQAATAQRESVAGLVSSSADTLQNVSARFSEHVSTELSKISDVADSFSGSSTEMSSLAEAFAVAVNLFNDSNTQLIDHLLRIEQSMEQSTSRSDEQMGYYVAQAREIIDQSLLSQREVFEELRALGEGTDDVPAEAS